MLKQVHTATHPARLTAAHGNAANSADVSPEARARAEIEAEIAADEAEDAELAEGQSDA